MDESLSLLTPAKVNLILRVLDRRADGYHNVWSVMQTVGLADELALRVRPDGPAVQLECDNPALPRDGANLVVRAAQLVLERSGRRVAVALRLQKRIPVGAGLGGGSSNAAGTIVGLNHLLGLGWSRAEMASLGAELGSDVPFFFFAPTAVVSGRGEAVSSMQLDGERWVVLIDPGFPVKTAEAYVRLTAGRQLVRPVSAAQQQLAGRPSLRWEDIVPLMENDFEAALAPIQPVFGELKTALRDAGAEAALLSGSGSTVFGLFADPRTAERAQSIIRRAGYRAWAVPARQPSSLPMPCVG